MTKLLISNNEAIIVKLEGYTSGMIGARLELEFSDEWAGLLKKAVFRAGSCRRDAVIENGFCTIPHELLAVPGERLELGIYGWHGGETCYALPTVYASLGKIQAGAEPSGDETAEPTLPVWAELEQSIGELGELQTADKSSLVAAINEACSYGGGVTAAYVAGAIAEAIGTAIGGSY